MINATEQVETGQLELGELSRMAQLRTRAAEYLELTKLRLNTSVVMTTFMGFYLAETGGLDGFRLFHTLLGTMMVAGGASALNQVLERENDSLMNRTRNRPLPSGRIEPRDAMVAGLLLGLGGMVYLWLAVNLLTSFIGLVSFVIYVAAYTPMKVRTAWNTAVGAISGALPPVMGWTAVRGRVDLEAYVLFGILFLWQLPHFFAISWRLREDYTRGGFHMLSRRDHHGAWSGVLMGAFCVVLLPVSLMLTMTGITGRLYLVGALVLGLAYLAYSTVFAVHRTDQAARKVFLMSLLYIPALLMLMVVDRIS